MQRLVRQSELLMISLKSAHEANVTMATDESSVHNEASGWSYRKGLSAYVVTKKYLQTFQISLNKDFIKSSKVYDKMHVKSQTLEMVKSRGKMR